MITKNPRSRDVSVYIDCDLQLENGAWQAYTSMPTDAVSAPLYMKLLTAGGIKIAPSPLHTWNGKLWAAPTKEALAKLAGEERTTRMDALAPRINYLRVVEEDGDLTKEEAAELASLVKLRSTIRRMDLSAYPDITWPVA